MTNRRPPAALPRIEEANSAIPVITPPPRPRRRPGVPVDAADDGGGEEATQQPPLEALHHSAKKETPRPAVGTAPGSGRAHKRSVPAASHADHPQPHRRTQRSSGRRTNRPSPCRYLPLVNGSRIRQPTRRMLTNRRAVAAAPKGRSWRVRSSFTTPRGRENKPFVTEGHQKFCDRDRGRCASRRGAPAKSAPTAATDGRGLDSHARTHTVRNRTSRSGRAAPPGLAGRIRVGCCEVSE